MKLKAAVASLCLALVLVSAASARPWLYVLPGEAVFPEGVAFEPATGNFYVTSTTDGSVLRGHLDEPAAQLFIRGDGRMFSAIGIKVSADGRLVVAGGQTGEVRTYDAATGTLRETVSTGAGGFLNDLAITPDGIFVTDSLRPILWRVPPGGGSVEPFLNFTGTPFQYLPGFNANGIVPSEDGRYLIVAQTNAGKLFRVTIATREVVEIDLGGEPVPADGLQLAGRTLWAVSAGAIVRVTLSDDLTSGRVYSRTVDKNFRAPTTNALADGQMLVVNSQFPARATGAVLPFTVSSIGIP